MSSFGSVESEVMLDENLSLPAKGLYGIISVHCGDKSYCWPSVSRLAKISGKSRSTVLRLLTELKDSQHITRSFDDDRQKTLTYKNNVHTEI